jgi:hypothetical protein
MTDDLGSQPLEHLPCEAPSKSVYRRLRAVSDAEKEAFMAQLLKLWKSHPQLRFGQLLTAPYLDASTLRGLEDEVLLDGLKSVYSSVQQEKGSA